MSAGVRCYFVHGWGMNSAVWQDCLERLSPMVDPVCIDLPGHGTQRDNSASGLPALVQHAIDSADRPGVWVGWSLGGLVTLQLARAVPEKVTALFQVACNPCFVQREDWSCAVDAAVFESFSDSLREDAAGTIRRFLALQVRGTGAGMATVRRLQRALDERGRATMESLQDGLDILIHADARTAVRETECPQHWVFGERDALVPVAVREALPALNPWLATHVIAAAGHAPFISHATDFANLLNRVLEA